MIYMIPKDELYHHGVKGMKWGVRRAQKRSEKSKARIIKEVGGEENFNKIKSSLKEASKHMGQVWYINDKIGKVYNDHYVRKLISKDQMDTKLSELRKERRVHAEKGEEIAKKVLTDYNLGRLRIRRNQGYTASKYSLVGPRMYYNSANNDFDYRSDSNFGSNPDDYVSLKKRAKDYYDYL